MHIHKVTVRNFRLLADAELALETPTTLIVGRNNSGKTSLSGPSLEGYSLHGSKLPLS